MKHGTKYVDSAKALDKTKLYEPNDALSTVCSLAKAKFDETVEVHIRTGCDGRHAEQQIRGAVVLPNGTGKTVRVLVFAKGDKISEAEAAGARESETAPCSPVYSSPAPCTVADTVLAHSRCACRE